MNLKNNVILFLGSIVWLSSAKQIEDIRSHVPPVVVINVLPKKYYEDCHIVGSLNVPIQSLQAWAHPLSRDTRIIVYCAHAECSNGPEAWGILKKMGFTHIRDYAGGSAAWYQAGLPLEGPCQQPYLNNVYNAHLDYGAVDIIDTMELFQVMKNEGLLS